MYGYVQGFDPIASPGNTTSPLISEFSQPVCGLCPRSRPSRAAPVPSEFDTPASCQLLRQQHDLAVLKHSLAPSLDVERDSTDVPLQFPADLWSNSTPPAAMSAPVSEDTIPSLHEHSWGQDPLLCPTSCRTLRTIRCLQQQGDSNPLSLDVDLLTFPSRAQERSPRGHAFKGAFQRSSSPPRMHYEQLKPISEPCDSDGFLSPPQHGSLSPHQQVDRNGGLLQMLPAEQEPRFYLAGNAAYGSSIGCLESPVGGQSTSPGCMKLLCSAREPDRFCASGVILYRSTAAEENLHDMLPEVFESTCELSCGGWSCALNRSCVYR